MKTLLRLCLLVLLLPLAATAATTGLVPWQPYGDAAFAQARAERRFVLLELEAVWCHWCHVMDERTWTDPRVAAAVARDFVPVRADHDARPDLAERYRDYGWPAIIVLDGSGREIVKRAGYLAPERMLALLAAIVADPSPEAAAAAGEPENWAVSPLLDRAVAVELEQRFVASHDFALGGLLGAQKVVDRDAAEYALLRAAAGDRVGEVIARSNLAAARRLADPVWGGIYQYSTGGDWNHPHFEKLGFIQADYLRLFALGYAAFRDPRDAAVMAQLHAYLRRFLQAPDGSFYTSQDADLKPGEHAADYFALPDRQRLTRGIPRVDRHIYAKENGLLAAALVQAHLATGCPEYLADARRAVERMLATRRLAGGGFSHDAGDAGGPYLADNLAMLRALLALHGTTGERSWLAEAVATADFIDARFRRPAAPGYLSAAANGPLAPVPTLDENLALARAANLLGHYSGAPRHRAMAENAMRYIVTPDVALARLSDPGILIAARELGSDPAHLTVVGSRGDVAAAALFRAAADWPVVYKRVEWWDRAEGPLPNADVVYPQLAKAAAYVCSAGRCSRPLFATAELLDLAAELNAPR